MEGEVMHTSSNTKPTPDVVAAVVRRISDAKGYAPSTREIAIELGVHQTQAVRYVKEAAEAGTVTRMEGRSRAIAAVNSSSAGSQPTPVCPDEEKETNISVQAIEFRSLTYKVRVGERLLNDLYSVISIDKVKLAL
jgi:DNA-binding transcriptional regulator YhcF (GntR family)